MKAFFLFLFLSLCIGCTSKVERRTHLLYEKLAVIPLSSTSFDSLLQEVRELPVQQRVAIISKATCREEEEIGALSKQEELLLEILPLTSKKKNILLQLCILYKKMDSSRIPYADTKGIKCCEELEKNYSLSQEEQWKIKRIKARLLNRRGRQKQYLPIWAELLSEHQAANNPELIIEDLCAIANHFTQLGDLEKGLSLYREAHQLAIDNQFPKLQEKCLVALIHTSIDSKKFHVVISSRASVSPEFALLLNSPSI